MNFVIAFIIFISTAFGDDGMFDASGFDTLYNQRMKAQNETNDFDFRLVDQFGTAHSLSDHYDNSEISITAFMPNCFEKQVIKNTLGLIKNKTSHTSFIITPDLKIKREVLIKSYPRNLILMDEFHQVSSSFKFVKAGDYAVLDVKTHKVIRTGNLLEDKKINFGSNSACTIPFVTYEPKSFKKKILPAIVHSCLRCHSNKQTLNFFKDVPTIQSWKQMMLRMIRLKRMPPGAEPYYGKMSTLHTHDDLFWLTKWLEAGAPDEEGNNQSLQYVMQIIKEYYKQFLEIDEDEKVELFSLPEEIVEASGSDFYKQYLQDKPTTRDYYFTKFNVVVNGNVAHHLALHFSSKPFPKIDPLTQQPEKASERMQLYGNNPIAISGTHNKKPIKGTKFNDPNIIHLSRISGFLKAPEKTYYHIPKGSYLNFEVHYNPSGKKESSKNIFTIFHNDKFAKNLSLIRRMSMTPDNKTVVAEPGEKNSVVTMSFKITTPISLRGFGLHMHYRGRSGKLFIQRPNEKKRSLAVNFPTYLYKVQTTSLLDEPISLPKGTILTTEIVYDNSTENLSNPDPKLKVEIGGSVLENENYLPRILYTEIK